MVLADTNILLRSVHPQHPQHALARNALSTLRLRNEVLCVAPQNLVEFWAVATRSREENGLGMMAARAAEEVSDIQDFFRVLPYTAEVVSVWQRIALNLQVVGKQTHDAHIVALMQTHSVASILTFNDGHFRRYPGITALNPAEFSFA